LFSFFKKKAIELPLQLLENKKAMGPLGHPWLLIPWKKNLRVPSAKIIVVIIIKYSFHGLPVAYQILYIMVK
jgi:hypothetical protein